MKFKDIETGCRHYWSVISEPVNGWNQSICPLTGVQSHTVLGWLYDQFGRDEVVNNWKGLGLISDKSNNSI